MLKYIVQVGWTSRRPVRPDEYVSRVVIMEDSDHNAHLTAAYMVANRTGCVMITSTKIEEVEL